MLIKVLNLFLITLFISTPLFQITLADDNLGSIRGLIRFLVTATKTMKNTLRTPILCGHDLYSVNKPQPIDLREFKNLIPEDGQLEKIEAEVTILIKEYNKIIKQCSTDHKTVYESDIYCDKTKSEIVSQFNEIILGKGFSGQVSLGISISKNSHGAIVAKPVAIKELLDKQFWQANKDIEREASFSDEILAKNKEPVIGVVLSRMIQVKKKGISHSQNLLVSPVFAGGDLEDEKIISKPKDSSSGEQSRYFGTMRGIFLQVAQGLSTIHENHIIYRDLKPENVLLRVREVGGEIEAGITDFGGAIRPEINEAQTVTSHEGTPFYYAPETLGKPPIQGQKQDCYALGIMIFQKLSQISLKEDVSCSKEEVYKCTYARAYCEKEKSNGIQIRENCKDSSESAEFLFQKARMLKKEKCSEPVNSPAACALAHAAAQLLDTDPSKRPEAQKVAQMLMQK